MPGNPKFFNRNKWYYNIEIEPGVFTPGSDRPSLALIRKLLRNVDVRDKDCMDIGTMEGVIPILLKRGGAKSVVAYDRFIESPRWMPDIKRVHDVDFEFVGGLRLEDLGARLDEKMGNHFFDLVVFSGVLYHLINPHGVFGVGEIAVQNWRAVPVRDQGTTRPA
ncbi:MAG: methyltransferase domain-containing protein [Anaerolineales bacterium]